VINASKLLDELKKIQASAGNENSSDNNLEDMRMSIRKNTELQDLFKEGDHSSCKVFSLQINVAKEIYSDFKKNKFLDSRLLAILENT